MLEPSSRAPPSDVVTRTPKSRQPAELRGQRQDSVEWSKHLERRAQDYASDAHLQVRPVSPRPMVSSIVIGFSSMFALLRDMNKQGVFTRGMNNPVVLPTGVVVEAEPPFKLAGCDCMFVVFGAALYRYIEGKGKWQRDVLPLIAECSVQGCKCACVGEAGLAVCLPQTLSKHG